MISVYVYAVYLGEYRKINEKGKLREKAIYGDGDRPNGPKCIMGIRKRQERTRGHGAESYRTILRKGHLKEADGPPFILAQHVIKAYRYIAQKRFSIRLAESGSPSLTLQTITSVIVLH